ncbi:MAG: lysophospholipid acyltransferase family protein [Prolixibacteraceae bacterium]|nr:lysophospholipid acyltransferase family protein [Prolixibacteraceae bacterium]
MITASHHWFLYPFFEWYGDIRISNHFKKIHITGNIADRDLPFLIIPNHFSWWDGFFISYLNRRIFHKKFHVMMLEQQLRTHSYFRKTGAFSIESSPKDIIKSMCYAAEILQNPENLLTFFPQGQFESSYQQPLHFKKGISWLLNNLRNEVRVIFAANLTEYFESPKPHLFIYFMEYNYRELGTDSTQIEKYYNDFYKKSFKQNLSVKNKTY